MLRKLLIEASRFVPDPVAVNDKLFDHWLANSADPKNPTEPKYFENHIFFYVIIANLMQEIELEWTI